MDDKLPTLEDLEILTGHTIQIIPHLEDHPPIHLQIQVGVIQELIPVEAGILAILTQTPIVVGRDHHQAAADIDQEIRVQVLLRVTLSQKAPQEVVDQKEEIRYEVKRNINSADHVINSFSN